MSTPPTPKRQTWISGSPENILSFLVTLGYLDPGPKDAQPASYAEIAKAIALFRIKSGPLRNCFRLDTSQSKRHSIAFRGAIHQLILKQLSIRYPGLLFERLRAAWSVSNSGRRREANESVPAPFTEYAAWQDGLKIRSAIYSDDPHQPPLRYESACGGRIVVITEDPRELERWLINYAYLHAADWDGHPYWPLVVDISTYATAWANEAGESQLVAELGPHICRKPASIVTITAMRRSSPCVVELDVETLGLPPSVFAKALQTWFPAHSRVGYFETSLVEWRLRFWEVNATVTLRRTPDQLESRTDLWLTLSSGASATDDAEAQRAEAFEKLYAEAHSLDKLLGLYSENDEPAGDWCDLEQGLLTKWPNSMGKGGALLTCVRRVNLSASNSLNDMKDRLSHWSGTSLLWVTISSENGRYFIVENLPL